jgi:hypothetical protein
MISLMMYDIFFFRSCFDTSISDDTTTAKNSLKKSKKGPRPSEDDDWHLHEPSKALFVMPKNDAFNNAMSNVATTPFVFMQPVADLEAAPELMKDILKHRISHLLANKGCVFSETTKTLDQLEETFHLQSAELKRWTWPETSNKENFSKGDDKNRAAYCPSKNDNAMVLWNSFKVNLEDVGKIGHQDDDDFMAKLNEEDDGRVVSTAKKYLEVFRSGDVLSSQKLKVNEVVGK